MSRPVAGGGRWVSVPPERLARWLDGFAAQHGEVAVDVGPTEVVVRGTDGAVATVEVPFPPLTVAAETGLDRLVEHALARRMIGVLLVRLGGHAAGVYDGSQLVASKVGSRYVQGRTAAGGWSQQRYARRRAGQAAAAYAAAAEDACTVLLSRPLDALVLGGDRTGVDAVLADRRLAPLRGLVTGQLLAVPDPRLSVLQTVRCRDVRILVR